jgi:hypothetical protein
MRKGIVIFQPVASAKHQTNNYIEFTQSLKDINPKEAYKQLQTFFRYPLIPLISSEKFHEGYNYIGYYQDLRQIYHFVFAPGSRSDESAGLRFEGIYQKFTHD